ncbi:MAG: UbiA family prenyltransferase [Euryarchaeota archaeon]|nr:UbiA family prenyltransferase [Euryarchaeota archaeon]
MTFHTRSYIAELRPFNCAMAAGASLIGIFVSSAEFTSALLITALFAFTAVFLITGGGNVINDYFDVDIDRINKPTRPLPAGLITQSKALVYACILLLLGTILASLLNSLCLAIAALSSALLILYSWRLKRSVLIGNLLVGYLTGSVFLFGGASVHAFYVPAVLFISAMFAIVSREIVKDIEDLAGDRRMGATTLPIKYGDSLSRKAAVLFMLIAVAVSPIPFIISAFGFTYLSIIAVADVALLAAAAFSWKSAASSARYMKYGMVIVLAAYVLGRITL